MKCIMMLFLVFSFFPHTAYACSCMEVTVKEAVKTADVIFIGTVKEFSVRGQPKAVDYESRKVDSYREGRRAVMSVNKLFKGDAQGSLEVYTGEGGGDCGFDFQVGREYLVYAYKGEKGRLETGICTRTREVWYNKYQDAKEDIRVLEKLGK